MCGWPPPKNCSRSTDQGHSEATKTFESACLQFLVFRYQSRLLVQQRGMNARSGNGGSAITQPHSLSEARRGGGLLLKLAVG